MEPILPPPQGQAFRLYLSLRNSWPHLWLLGSLSLTHPRTEATLVPYCPVASIFPDDFRLFLHIIHTYKYHNILRSHFSWRFQSLRDLSGLKGPIFPDVFQMCGICQTGTCSIDFCHRIRFRFLILDVSQISLW